ncbi:MAG: SARP family transcriptional regulator [Catenulispora sp.]|nr:SARP family transcriptional regulator [Catenulispora sp.]
MNDLDKTLSVRVLGPLRARLDGREVELGPPRQQALFAVLALRAGRVVDRDDLVDAVWGVEGPGNPVGGVHTYVADLRRRFEPGRPRRSTGTVLVSRGSGYRLNLRPDRLDANEFERLRTAARRAGADGDPAAQAAHLDAALALFDGSALAGVPGPFAQAQRVVWAERRQHAVADRLAAVLAQGRAEEVVADLRALAQEHPLRERIWSLLMLALYRCGRKADALDAYDQARTVSAEELGLDPGQELRDLRQRIIESDPGLNGPALDRPGVNGSTNRAATIAAPVSPAVRETVRQARCDLPHDLEDFTGRADEMARIVGSLGGVPGVPGADGTPTAPTMPTTLTMPTVWALDGMAGIGKTALAVHVAHRLAPRFPDAQLFVDLHAHSPDQPPSTPQAALDQLLRAIGVEGPDIPADPEARAALWRARLAGTRTLIVLDNAASSAQIRPLLPGVSGCLVLATSRRRLTGLDAEPLSLAAPPTPEAVELFASVVGDGRPTADPGAVEAVEAVVGLCGNLPLAVRIAAARLRHRPAWDVGHLADRLRDEERRLTELKTEDRGVGPAFALSYQALDPPVRRLFRLLGLMPGPTFGALTAAALGGLARHEADEYLETLLDANLVSQRSAAAYGLHDLVRVFTRQRCLAEESEDTRRRALGRLVDFYMHATNHAEDLIRPGRLDRGPDAPPGLALPVLSDRDAALAWLDSERANLRAVVTAAADQSFPEAAWRIPRHLWGYFEARSLWSDWTQCSRLALPATRLLGDRLAEARTLVALGVTAYFTGACADALDPLRQAVVLMREIGFRAGEAGALANMANCYRVLGRFLDGAACLEQAQQVLDEAEDPFTAAVTAMNIGELRREAGLAAQSLPPLNQALAITRDRGFRKLEGNVLDGLARSRLALGQPEASVDLCRTALAVRADCDDRFGTAITDDCLGQALAVLGRMDEARQSWLRALRTLESLGAPEAAAVRARLSLSTAEAGDVEQYE